MDAIGTIAKSLGGRRRNGWLAPEADAHSAIAPIRPRQRGSRAKRHPTPHGRRRTPRRQAGDVRSKRRTPRPRSPTWRRTPAQRRPSRRRPRSLAARNRLRRRPTTPRTDDEPTPRPQARSDSSLPREFGVDLVGKRPFVGFPVGRVRPNSTPFWNNG